MNDDNKNFTDIIERNFTLDTDKGPIDYKTYVPEDAYVRTSVAASEGDTVRVVKGKKIPLNTTGKILKITYNKYSYGAKDAYTKADLNPSILMQLEDGTEVWTSGNNLIKISSEKEKIIDVVETSDLETIRKKWPDTKPIWIKTLEGKLGYFHKDALSTDFEVKESKETENENVMILLNRKSGTYEFLVTDKKYYPGNEKVHKKFGIDARLFLGESTTRSDGYTEVKKLFEEYK